VDPGTSARPPFADEPERHVGGGYRGCGCGWRGDPVGETATR
jgi:hypothetical protein